MIGSSDRLELRDCTFRVSERRRQAVIRSGQREVHAWVTGTLVTDPADPPGEAMDFTYNPFRAPTFTRLCDGAPIWAANTCWFIGRRAIALP